MEQKQQMNNNGFNTKEKVCTLQSLIYKLNKSEITTFGNYHVNFKEMFPKEEDYKDYLKKHVSLFNDDLVNKEKYTGTMNSFLLPKFFHNFHENTLFYIFYYLTRDTLQLFAGEHLYKKGWKYNHKYQIWFKQIKDDKWEFFNPLEWKKKEFIYGAVDTQNFLTEDEAKQYLKQFENENNKKDKKRQGQKSSSSSSSANANNNNTNNNHQQYMKQQQQQQQQQQPNNNA